MKISDDRKKRRLILGYLVILWLFFVSWCLITLSLSHGTQFTAEYMVTVFLTETLIYLCFRKNNAFFTDLISNQIDILMFIISIVSFILFPFEITKLIKAGNTPEIVVLISWIILCAVIIFSRHNGRSIVHDSFEMIVDMIKHAGSRKGLLILLAATLILCFEHDVPLFKWDSYLYYTAAQRFSLDSLSSLAAFGHLSQTYGAVIYCIDLVCKDLQISMTIANISIMILSTSAFYGIMRITVPERKDWEYSLVSSIYAFSPFVLGMVHYQNLDYFCLCLFTIMFYFAVSQKWVWQTVTALMFCFTKEPAIIIYGCFCIGYVIMDLISLKRSGNKHIVKTLIGRSQYMFMITTALFWFVIYKALGTWSAGNGGFAIDKAHILDNLKLVYVLNFNWILVIITMIVLVYSAVRNKPVSEWMWPLVFSHIGFVLFGCAFSTTNNPRYIDSAAFMLYFVTAAGILKLLHGARCYIISSALAAVMLISCFLTIDPVSRMAFRCYNIGSTEMVSCTGAPLGDAMIYNRQMIYYDEALNRAMKDHVEAGDVIAFASYDGNSYFMNGMDSVKCDERVKPIYQKEYWDEDMRNLIGKGEEISIYQVASGKQIEELITDEHKVSVFWVTGMIENPGKDLDDLDYQISENETMYKNWRIMCTTYQKKR